MDPEPLCLTKNLLSRHAIMLPPCSFYVWHLRVRDAVSWWKPTLLSFPGDYRSHFCLDKRSHPIFLYRNFGYWHLWITKMSSHCGKMWLCLRSDRVSLSLHLLCIYTWLPLNYLTWPERPEGGHWISSDWSYRDDSHHGCAGNWTHTFWKSSKCFQLLCHLSKP